MSKKRYNNAFNIEAVKHVTERAHVVTDVAARLDVSLHSLYQWIKRFSATPAGLRRLKAELKRVSEERDTLPALIHG
jgi:transposase-like protein